MAKGYSISVGTMGQGIWHSPDSGGTWTKIGRPIPLESQVRALAAYPDNPHRLLAGSDNGVFQSEDQGASWTKLESPMDGMQIWCVVIDPEDSNVIYAGVKPPAVFRSRDGGQRWEKLSLDIAEECVIGLPRVTAIVIDPQDHRTILVGVEVDGVFRSQDGGDTWTHLPDLGSDAFHQDIHGIAVSPGEPKRVLISTPRNIFESTDLGDTWDTLIDTSRFPGDFCREVRFKEAAQEVIFVANGGQESDQTGSIQRSTDGGETWQQASLPAEPNSRMWLFAIHPTDPNLILSSSLFGEIYASSNGGDSWNKLKREFSEIRSLAWTPN